MAHIHDCIRKLDKLISSFVELEPFYRRAWDELKIHVAKLEPRVFKLADKDRPFVVVGEHEDYYMTVYSLIRIYEMEQETWTEQDEVMFTNAARRHAARHPTQPSQEESHE